MKRMFSYRIAEILSLAITVLLILPAGSLASAPSDAIVIPIKNLTNEVKRERTLPGPTSASRGLALSPDGRILASASDLKGMIILWDAATWKELKILNAQMSSSVSFSPDGRILASNSDGGIILWNVATGDKLKTLKKLSADDYRTKALAFSPDGQILATAFYQNKRGSVVKPTIVLWDVATGNQLKTLVEPRASADSLAFSPDGRLLAAGMYMETAIWNVQAGTKIKSLSHPHFVPSVAFSPDGNILACGNRDNNNRDNVLFVWEVNTGNKFLTLSGHTKAAEVVAFSPDGKLLASGGDDKNLILWKTATGNKTKTLAGHSWNISSLAFSPDGRYIASGGYAGQIIIWNLMGSYLAKTLKKDEVETTAEYEKRVKGIEVPYSASLDAIKYDADKGGFNAEVEGARVFIPVPREKAREIIGRKEKIHVEGSFTYHDAENVALVNASLVDEGSNERFAVRSVVERPVVASIQKPGNQKTASENIHAIPDLKAAPRHKDVAIVIGIENYRGLPKSDFSKSDAGLVKDYLRALGIQERNIEFLTDEKATKTDIEKSLEAWLPNRVNKEGLVFVYYSGHGSPDPQTGEAYMVPYDGDPNYLSVTGYPLKRLYEKLGKLNAGEVIVVLDSCFSGSGGRSVLAKGARPLVMMAENTVDAHNMVVLTATQGSQISMSSPERGHGIFTYHFLMAIKNGKKNLAEIYETIKPLVEDEAKALNVQQTPHITPGLEKIKDRFSLR